MKKLVSVTSAKLRSIRSINASPGQGREADIRGRDNGIGVIKLQAMHAIHRLARGSSLSGIFLSTALATDAAEIASIVCPRL
jgi:hypothetical protein